MINMQISDALKLSSILHEFSDTPRLDAETILGHVMQRDRAWLYTWPDKSLTAEQSAHFQDLLEQRRKGCPVAYLLGHKEFWSLKLKVTPATLIPRPETELLVDIALNLFASNRPIQIADLGTGSGAIALAIASERPHWQVVAVDQQRSALAIAESNRVTLNLNNVTMLHSDWCAALPVDKLDLIISNPPYILIDDPCLSSLQYEPKTALVAACDGLADITIIASQSCKYLKCGGYLLLEHGWQQAGAVSKILEQYGYSDIKLFKDLAGLDRATLCQWV